MTTPQTRIEILKQLSEGSRPSDIAKTVCLSPRTIETKIQQLRERFECKTTAHLVAKAIRVGLIPLLLFASCSVIAQMRQELKVGPVTVIVGESKPCDIDTIKGTLVYHQYALRGTEGNVDDVGYWVGKCGPLYMDLKEMIFIPGIMKTIDGYYRNDTWGKFYNYQWKEVKAENVYCLYQLRKSSPVFPAKL